MKISLEKLDERLNQLENEQIRQTLAMRSLRTFGAEVKKYEALLKRVYSFENTLTPQTDFSKLRDLKEIQRIEEELAKVEGYIPKDSNESRYFEEIKQLKAELTQGSNNTKPLIKTTTPKTSVQITPISTPPMTPVKPTVEKQQVEDFAKLRDTEEIERLEAQLDIIDKYKPNDADELRYFEEITQLKSELSPNTNKVVNNSKKGIELLIQDSETTQTTIVKGYVIRLMFNPEAPTEWSEEGVGGWRTIGMGTCYKTPDQIKQCLLKLRKRWPNYPLKIVKR